MVSDAWMDRRVARHTPGRGGWSASRARPWTLDAPIFNHLDRGLVQATVAPVSTPRNILNNAELESLRIDIQTAGGEDETHVWDAIGVIGAENSWVKNATSS